MEATDDIIDGLIGQQVDKIGSLLLRSLGQEVKDQNDDEHRKSVGGLGSINNLLQLGTACSGTDAPALALTLIQEQMEVRGLTKEKGKRLEFEHGFSCENDPFKQGMYVRVCVWNAIRNPTEVVLIINLEKGSHHWTCVSPTYSIFGSKF